MLANSAWCAFHMNVVSYVSVHSCVMRSTHFAARFNTILKGLLSVIVLGHMPESSHFITFPVLNVSLTLQTGRSDGVYEICLSVDPFLFIELC